MATHLSWLHDFHFLSSISSVSFLHLRVTSPSLWVGWEWRQSSAPVLWWDFVVSVTLQQSLSAHCVCMWHWCAGFHVHMCLLDLMQNLDLCLCVLFTHCLSSHTVSIHSLSILLGTPVHLFIYAFSQLTPHGRFKKHHLALFQFSFLQVGLLCAHYDLRFQVVADRSGSWYRLLLLYFKQASCRVGMLCIMRCSSAHHGYKEWLLSYQSFPVSMNQPDPPDLLGHLSSTRVSIHTTTFCETWLYNVSTAVAVKWLSV